jgi:hypothetical protein
VHNGNGNINKRVIFRSLRQQFENLYDSAWSSWIRAIGGAVLPLTSHNPFTIRLHQPEASPLTEAETQLLQRCVLGFGLLKDGDVGVGIFPVKSQSGALGTTNTFVFALKLAAGL